MNEVSKKEPKDSFNVQLLRKGYVKLDTQIELPEGLADWGKEQEYAEDKKLGIWNFDEEDDE